MCVGPQESPQEGCTLLQLASFRDMSYRACLYLMHVLTHVHVWTHYTGLAYNAALAKALPKCLQLHSILPIAGWVSQSSGVTVTNRWV